MWCNAGKRWYGDSCFFQCHDSAVQCSACCCLYLIKTLGPPINYFSFHVSLKRSILMSAFVCGGRSTLARKHEFGNGNCMQLLRALGNEMSLFNLCRNWNKRNNVVSVRVSYVSASMADRWWKTVQQNLMDCKKTRKRHERTKIKQNKRSCSRL